MKKQLNTAIAALFLATASMTAMALEESGKGYIGVSFGKSSTDIGITSLTGTASLDEDDQAVKIFAGFDVDKNLSIEGHYANIGEFSISGNNGDTYIDESGNSQSFSGTVTKKLEYKTYGLSGIYKFDKINETTPFIKLGLHRWDEDFSISDGSSSLSANGTDPFYGLGLSTSLSDGVDVRFEFERFEVGRNSGNIDIDYVSLGIVNNF